MAKKANKTFRISGRVIDSKTRQGVPGLSVEGWDKDLICNDPVGSAVTDADGAFKIDFDESHFKELFLDRQPDLFFKLFRGHALITTTEDSVLWNVAAGHTEVVIEMALPGTGKAKSYVVSGQVRREDGLPVHGMKVRAFHEYERGAIRLGEDATDAAGRYTIRYELLPGVDAIHLRVSVMDADGELLQSAEVILNAKPLEIIDLTLPMTPKPATQRRIEGRIVLEHGLPAEQLKLRLYRLDFGCKATLLNETLTLAGGQYAFTYDPGGNAMSLEVRAVKGANEEIPLSKPLNDISGEPRLVVNLIAPGVLQPLAAEYRRLSADLTTHVGQMTKLAEARENNECQDLTVLNRATGWDARLIALAATTERLSADVDVNLPQEAVYGLLRAGLPSDKLLLAQVEPDVAEQALKTVRDAGIVAFSDQQIGEFKSQFTTFSNTVRLNIPAPGSRSTYGAFLKTLGLSQDAQDKFFPIYLNHRGDAAQLWNEARKAGLDDGQIGQLQLQGKFAFLAGNSEVMTTRLLGKKINDPVQLVEQDFHRADLWIKEVFDQAGIPAARRNNLTEADKTKLDVVIPAAYAAEKVEDRLNAYAEDMARKVRLSYPTQVVGRMIEKDEIKLPAAGDATAKLLKDAAGQGFRLGETPVAAFLKTRPGVTAGMAAPVAQAAQQQLQTIQRVYQITPSNEAMPVLMSLGMTSAYDVMAYSELEFVALYAGKYFDIYGRAPTQAESRLVYPKAKQVSSVTYNLFTIAKKLDSEPSVAGMSAPVEVRESVRNELIKQFPTMESLFGSMDFCECEHCRSVLSPAAYLVDLLQFIDADPGVWRNFLALWEKNHGGHQYTNKYKKPYDALIERRPDIPHISLTCENTHTALPYIDVVNEILEYYVANGKLEEEAAHDTGEATTPELLAEPQNVIRGAYDTLREARYPLNLPFDLWIETVRQFCNYFETPLARVLEVFRPNDDLFAPAQPIDRFTIFMESLGLSPAETVIFTEPDPLTLGKWHELFGYPRAEIGSPSNAANATVNVPNPAADLFSVGDKCSYYDAATGALQAEAKEISAIGAKDSGGQGQAMITFVGLWPMPPKVRDMLVLASVPELLTSAKTLSRRLGVTYKEIAEIAQTGFVNPKLEKLVFLYKLGVTIQDASFYKDHKTSYEQNKDLLGKDRSSLSAVDQLRFDSLSQRNPKTQKTGWEDLLEVRAFEQRLKELGDEFNVPLAQFETQLQAIPFNGVLLLADPDGGCNFDRTTLRYANGDPADAVAFLRINLFVRLWRKLGWSIEETDRALQAFVPKNAPFKTAHLNNQPLKTALIYLAHLKALDEKVRVGKQSRIKLITLWSDITTTGKKPLYAQLFLTRSVLKSDIVFDHPLGKYLQYFDTTENKYKPFRWDSNQPEDPATGNISLKTHLIALQGALGLTADEISRILVDSGKSFDTAELSLQNASLLYRYGLLAKALKLSVRELIAVKQLSGLDPFTLLHSDPLTTLNEDYPFSQTLRFVEVAAEVKESGLKIEDLEYLLRHRFDETGKYRPNREATLTLLKAIAEGVRAIRTEHAVPDDPGAMSEGVLRQKLGLALPSDAVERFLAMMNGTAEFSVTKTGVAAANQLTPEDFTDEPAIREVRYNDTRQEQKLTVRVFDPHRAGLEARHASGLLADLMEDVQARAGEFFENELKKQTLRLNDEAGFLDDGDFSTLFDPLKPLLKIASSDSQQEIEDTQKKNEKIERENEIELQTRRHRISEAFLPFLQQRLIRQFIVQTMTAYTAADPALVESLLTDERLLAGPKPLMEAFNTTGKREITGTFFVAADGTGASLATVSLVEADTGLKDKDGNLLRPATANSARLEGYLEVPTPGAYRFYVALDKRNAEAELQFDHLSDPLFWKGAAAADDTVLGDKPEEYLELKPGILYLFRLDLKNLNGGEARLLVQGETLPKGPVSQLALYPLSTMAGAERAVLLLTKVLQLVKSLGLSEREIRYLLTHAAAFGGLSLSELPTQSGDDTPADRAAATERFARFLRLAAYTRLKRDLAGGTDDLIGIVEANEQTAADNLEKKVYPLIAKLTRRDEATVKTTAEALVAAPAFASEKPLQRLWEALQVVERLGVPAASLHGWTRIVSTAATPEQRLEIARDLKEAVKAHFEPETWQRVAQPIFDKLRQRQRDALVSHVMHRHGFASMEQLYEYFLIDPGMEPVVQTSRIRLAIASLQLFVQRCLLNMEPKVNPSVINAKQWEWMKRYRVWEANRKIFLFPENWLEPEFRDDKTHLFAELEGVLLQGDVSSDLVEDAFLNYLKKLDELARLDIVAMHLEDDSDPARRTLHVIGRTYSQPHKCFYRRYAHQMWTPWEPVSAEIEGDHLAPVVWRDRLYLFWVTFMDKPVENPRPTGTAANTRPTDLPPRNVVDGARAMVPNMFVEIQPHAHTRLTDLTLNNVIDGLQSMVANKTVEIQLHWSEYLQGEWSTRESGGFVAVISRTVPASFTPSSVFIHVSKAYDGGEERGVYITLGGAIKQSFYLAGRNSIPVEQSYKAEPANPYNANDVHPTRYGGDNSLTVTFKQRITTGGNQTKVVKDPLMILQEGASFTLLPCNNDITLGGPAPGSLDADKAGAVAKAIEAGLPEIASLMKPVFYQDHQHTLFVEPNVTERTIEDWKGWITITPQPGVDWRLPGRWQDVVVIPEIPWKPRFLDPRDPWHVPIDIGSLIKPKSGNDWLVNPLTGLRFDDEVIGPSGRAGILPLHEIVGAVPNDALLANIHASSDLPMGTVAVVPSALLEQAGLSKVAGGFNVVGGAGFSADLAQNVTALNRSRFDTGRSGSSRKVVS